MKSTDPTGLEDITITDEEGNPITEIVTVISRGPSRSPYSYPSGGYDGGGYEQIATWEQDPEQGSYFGQNGKGQNPEASTIVNVPGNENGFTDPFGLCPSDVKTDTYVAVSLEATVSFAALGPDGIAMATGSTLVAFTNLENGETFTSAYNFNLTSASGIVLSAGASLQLGAVVAEFPVGSTQESVANSYSGTFITDTLQLGPITGSTITSTQWNGASGGASAGLGAGFSHFTTTYGSPLW